MNFLNEDDIAEGSVLPIYLKDRLEGYAILITTTDDPTSFMELRNEEEDGPVYMRQRWLVEWATLDQIDQELNTEQYWNQRQMSGKRTHRYLIYKSSESWEQHTIQYGKLKSKNYYEREGRPLDDTNLLF